MKLTAHEQNLLNELSGFDSYDDLELAKGASMSSVGVGAKVSPIRGNPVFKAQFDLAFAIKYFEDNVIKTAAQIPASLQNQLPTFIFGNSDFAGGFAKIKSLFPTSTWSYHSNGIVGTGFSSLSETGGLTKTGDLVVRFTATVSTKVYFGEVIVNCPQVAYGTLLDAISSDRFIINMIRYTVNPLQTKQLKNQIEIVRQSIFGKTQNDFVSPNAYITGNTYNPNIADIPLEIGVDKNLILGSYIDYDVVEFTWTITVMAVQKR